MKNTSNVGTSGLESIRLGGMKIQDLPIAENALTRPQIPIVEDTEKQNKINDIIASSPKHRVDYLENRITECQENIIRVGHVKSQQQTLISEYNSQISLCKFRDTEIEKLTDDSERDVKIKQLNKQFPPYNVEAMETQVTQSTEAIERVDEVIANEYNSIAELREFLVLCQQRDTQLRALGVAVG